MNWHFVPTYRKHRKEADQIRRATIIYQQRQAQKERDEENEQTRHHVIVSAFQQIINAQHTYANDRRAESARSAARERRRFRLDVAGVVVAGAAAVFLLWQQNTMQGQLDEMRFEQRAWLAMSVTTTHLEVYRDRVGGPYITLHVSATNVGKSPARDVTFIPHVYVPVGPRQAGPADLANKLCIRVPFVGVAPLVAPGDIYSEDPVVMFNPQEIQEAWHSSKNELPFRVIIVVCTTYRLIGGDAVHYMAAVTQVYKTTEYGPPQFGIMGKYGD